MVRWPRVNCGLVSVIMFARGNGMGVDMVVAKNMHRGSSILQPGKAQTGRGTNTLLCNTSNIHDIDR